MSRHLRMLRLGHQVGMSSGVSALVHRFGLFAASFLVLWVVWSLLAVDASLDARQGRQDARSPVMTQQSQEAVAHWLERPDYASGQAISVIFLEPFQPDASPPPGLERWPERGESFLSSRAAEHAGGALVSRYGTMELEVLQQFRRVQAGADVSAEADVLSTPNVAPVAAPHSRIADL